jgi:hypothetical protein
MPFYSSVAKSTPTSGASGASGSSSSSNTVSSRSMDPAMLAVLKTLVAELQTGGSQYLQTLKGLRLGEVGAVQNQRQDYSKEAAFTDAQGAMAAQLRDAMESSSASLVKAAEGSGTSGSAMRALLLQNAQQNAADSAATLGLQAATNYGQLASNMSGILESLTRPNDPTTEYLLNALNIAKGSNESRTTMTGQSGAAGGSPSSFSTRVNWVDSYGRMQGSTG